MPRKERIVDKKSAPQKRAQSGISLAWKLLACFVAGLLVASCFWYWDLTSQIAATAAGTVPLRQPSDSYQFINPLLGYTLPEDIRSEDEYKPFEQSIENLVTNETTSAPDQYGVYFRDLSSARWAGVNEEIGFAPGSLMKVVLMIAYYEEAESDPSVLQQEFTYSSAVADQLNGVPFETPSDLQVGKTYTAEQLIESMIESSDNGAKNALLDNIDPAALGNITTDLGLPYLDVTQNYDNYAITPKEYSVLLRVLYNATYLSRSYSEKALDILSQAEYNQGILAGVPQGVQVAQKYGEAVDGNTLSPEITLSNCGIVYYPDHPYIICVMTEGKVLANLTATIAAISKLAWNTVGTYAKAGN